MRVPVYVAGASAEYSRAKEWARKLEATGFIRVTHDWWTSVEHHGVGGDHALTEDERMAYAIGDLGGVRDARVFWALWSDHRSNGRSIELGYALRCDDMVTVISGPSRGCIFASLADEYETDQEAFDAIVALARGHVGRPIAGSEAAEVP